MTDTAILVLLTLAVALNGVMAWEGLRMMRYVAQLTGETYTMTKTTLEIVAKLVGTTRNS